VYVSNESNNNVYFDNFQVLHERGPITEETHYYPFGLTMAGISSKALNGVAENKKKFTSQELNSDLDINWYEFRYRMMDPQIGRFMSVDPLCDSFPHNSTFAYAENDVIRSIDLEGLEKLEITSISQLIQVGSRKVLPMTLLEAKYDYNTHDISVTTGQTGQKANQVTYNTTTDEISATSFDLKASDIVAKYGQVGGKLPGIAVSAFEFLKKNNIDLGGVLTKYNDALQGVSDALKEKGIDISVGPLSDKVLQMIKDNMLTIQILDAPAETKQVTNADGSKSTKVYDKGTIYRGYLQYENSVIIFQYTDQTEKKNK
jgi:RHS repeat-associated protein